VNFRARERRFPVASKSNIVAGLRSRGVFYMDLNAFI
jgi:hypothetical protein